MQVTVLRPLALCVAVLACSSGATDPASHPEPLSFDQIEAGPEPLGFYGTWLVRDANGDPVPGATAMFAATGGSSVSPTSATTDNQAHVTHHWTIPASARTSGNKVALLYCLTVAATCTPADTQATITYP